jgi:hypothetical protein
VVTNPTPDFLPILETLVKHEVDFIVVGGVCAVLHGVPMTTFDLDLVHSRTPENLDRLTTALKELDAYYRGRGDQRLTPDLTHLSSAGHQLLMTRFGPLDVLGTIGVGQTPFSCRSVVCDWIFWALKGSSESRKRPPAIRTRRHFQSCDEPLKRS